jgi:hypothetical protein
MVKATDGFSTDDLCCSSTSTACCVYECVECNGPRYCQDCLLDSHRYLETHRIRASTEFCYYYHHLTELQIHRDGFFQQASLIDLGLVVQLNHRRGSCPKRVNSTTVFTVYDTNGCHNVRINYCGCARSLSDTGNTRLDQIFAQRWFPATWKRPQTVFTFNLLQTFHILNLQSKCNMYDYYHTILRRQDNAGISYQPVGHYIKVGNVYS